MKYATTDSDGRPGNAAERTTPGVVAAIVGAAFLAFFIAWIPLYNWLASVLGANNELGLGLVSALFWVVVFGVVIAAAMWSKTAFASWTTADIMLAAVLGAVFGLLFVVWASVYTATSGFLGAWAGLVNGFWLIPGIVVPYIIRKPGAALVGETLAGFLAVLMGSPWGFIGSAIAGLVQGIGAEAIFAVTGWRRYDWLTLTLAGLGSAIAGFVFVWPIWFITLGAELLIINFVAQVVSAIVFAVVGSKLLGDALLATGVLDRFAIGRERRAARQSSDF